MPFKTKREKIAASFRRFKFVEGQLINYEPSKNEKSIETNLDQKHRFGERRIEADYTYIKKDLAKIILVASALIGAQIFLKLILAR